MSSLKNCTRCNGVIWVDRDEYGWYEECLMCGFVHDLESVAVAGKNDQGISYPEEKISQCH